MMFDCNYFGMMMVEAGDADASITGLYSKYSSTVKAAKEVIGIKEGFNTFGALHIVNTSKGPLYIADTLINTDPDENALVDLVLLAEQKIKFFNRKPCIAMVGHSSFGSSRSAESVKIGKAVKRLHEDYPEIIVDGEVQLGYALKKDERDAKWPFTKFKGKEVNTLVFPNLTSARSSYKMLQAFNSDTEIIGPVQIGLNKPVHFVDYDSSVRDVLKVVAISVIDAYIQGLNK